MRFDWRKIIWWIFIIFILYSIFTSPQESAEVVRTIFEIIFNGFRALGEFFRGIMNG